MREHLDSMHKVWVGSSEEKGGRREVREGEREYIHMYEAFHPVPDTQ